MIRFGNMDPDALTPKTLYGTCTLRVSTNCTGITTHYKSPRLVLFLALLAELCIAAVRDTMIWTWMRLESSSVDSAGLSARGLEFTTEDPKPQGLGV